MLNPTDAQARGITHGDAVIVASPRGRVRLRAIVSADIIPGAIEANMGGGGPLGPKAWQECNINDLTDLRYDPISGFPIYKALLCEVARDTASGETLPLDSGETVALPEIEFRESARHRIYLDHNATTPPHPEVTKAMVRCLEEQHGNPSAIYREGRESKTMVEKARRQLANLLGTTARQTHLHQRRQRSQ